MAKQSKKSMFRDFKYRNADTLKRSYLKYLRLVVRDMCHHYDMKESELNFMMFAYDYEFFTLDHMSEAYFYRKQKLGERLVYPLMKKGYIYKYFDKLSPRNYQEAIFRENKYTHRVRYALTQKGRMLVQKYYRKLEGEEQINVPA